MANALSQIQHIVVVMFENRSFDNVLGYLYPPSRADFEGVARAKLPNLWNGRQLWPQHGTDMIQPWPDPNEEYQFVYRQIYNDFARSWPPTAPTLPPTMQGFVADYRTAKNVTDQQAPVIMNCRGTSCPASSSTPRPPSTTCWSRRRSPGGSMPAAGSSRRTRG